MTDQATLVTPGAPAGHESALPPAGRTRSRTRLRSLLERREAAIFVVAVVLFLYFALSTSAFATYDNLVTLSQFLAPIAVIGAAEAMLLTAGEVDLSAGTSFIFFPFVVYFLWQNSGVPITLAIILALVVAAMFGAINGVLTSLLGLPSFVTTLGTLFALVGVMLITSGDIQETFTLSGTGGNILGVSPWSEILWAVGLVAVMYVMLHRSRYGLHIIAAGGNQLGASEAGVLVNRVKIRTFVLCSVFSAFIGIVDAIRITTLDPGNDGTTEMFYAVAAAVIGGTALTGGRGTIIGAGLGALVLAILYDGLNIKGVNASYFEFALGLAILAAMVVNVQLRRATLRRWRKRRT